MLSSTTELNETQIHNDFNIVWFGKCNYISNEYEDIFKRSKICYTFDECNDYILNHQNKNQILLIFIDFYEYLSYFHDFLQIQLIYILSKNDQNIKINKKQYPKLTFIFHDKCFLIKRLRQDILLTYPIESSENIFHIQHMSEGQTLINLDQTKYFIWNHLLNYYLINTSNQDTIQLKKDMIDRCRLEYRNNESILQHIDKFDRNCTVKNAIQWYTKDSFVYRLVNKAYRNQNVAILWKFRYFIQLLYQQLKELSIEQQGENSIIVYRGQILEKCYIIHLKKHVGRLVSTSTLMSTTYDKDVANMLIADTTSAVLFEINATNRGNRSLYPFADISQITEMKHDGGEVLFFPGTIFRIDSVKQETNSIWNIKLTLINENIEIIKQLNSLLKGSILISSKYFDLLEKTNDYDLFNRYHTYLTTNKMSISDIYQLMKNININRLIDNSNDHQKAINYYQELLENNVLDQTKSIILNVLIGLNYFRISQYDYALDYYTDVLDLIDDNNRLKGEIYNYMGDVCEITNNLQTALLFYEKSTKIIINHEDKNKYIGKIYRKISQIHFEQNNYKDGKIYQNQADYADRIVQKKRIFIDNETSLQYQQELNTELDSNILEYAHILYTTGMGLIKRAQFHRGLKNLEEAEQLFKDYLPIYDLIFAKLAKIYEHATLAYFFLDDIFNALIMWRKAIDIRLSFNDYD